MVWRRGDDRLPARPFGVTFPDLARVTALTFDCYGTLIDWEAGAIEALRPLLARHGVTLPDDAVIQAFQGSTRNSASQPTDLIGRCSPAWSRASGDASASRSGSR